VTVLAGPRFGCRRHGERCNVPWGYDEAHTDQRYPYSLEQLVGRTDSPHRYAYPDETAYMQGWLLWRALARDGRPSLAEAEVGYRLRVRRVVECAAAERGCDVDELAASWGLA
jgi:hypothetical protein